MGKRKSRYDLDQMRIAAMITAQIVDELGQMVKPGANAAELEERARQRCREEGVEPAFLGYDDYEFALCLSVNDEVVHALPTVDKVFVEGDVVSVDFGVKWKGYYSDHCRTFAVGQLSPVHQKLLDIGEQAVNNAIPFARSGGYIGDISHAMQSTAEQAGFSIVTNYVGHSIGKHLHESPEIPAFGEPGTGQTLEKDMVICVECQVCEKSASLRHDRDGWTARTVDGGYSVMFEHMVHVTDGDPEILTRLS
jgi:methionyl aminopeptidase